VAPSRPDSPGLTGDHCLGRRRRHSSGVGSERSVAHAMDRAQPNHQDYMQFSAGGYDALLPVSLVPRPHTRWVGRISETADPSNSSPARSGQAEHDSCNTIRIERCHPGHLPRPKTSARRARAMPMQRMTGGSKAPSPPCRHHEGRQRSLPVLGNPVRDPPDQLGQALGFTPYGWDSVACYLIADPEPRVEPRRAPVVLGRVGEARGGRDDGTCRLHAGAELVQPPLCTAHVSSSGRARILGLGPRSTAAVGPHSVIVTGA
jgi:hypothetical protein